MFDVYGQLGDVRGCLVSKNESLLIFENKHMIGEKIVNLASATSYTLINAKADDDDALTINFEGGLEAGINSIDLLDVLIHREKYLCELDPSERRQMVVRSLQLTRSAMTSE